MNFAEQAMGAVGPFTRGLRRVIALATEGLIWLSTRGDSLRLARELRAV